MSEETARATSASSAVGPNMLLLNANATSSTFSKVEFAHSVFSEALLFNSHFNCCNFEGTAFSACDFDGAVVENSSLRAVELRNCDTEGLIINGVNVGALLKLLLNQ